MSQPFDFTTPITENTTLVARYRCGSAPYAGKWFRITDSTGKSYVPVSLSEAKKAFTGTNGYISVQLIDTTTGDVTTFSGKTISKIELGGGWEGYEPAGGTSGSWYTFASNVTYIISGFGEGLVNPNFLIIASNGGKVVFDRFKFDATQVPNLFNLNKSQLFQGINISSSSDAANAKYGIIEPLAPPNDVTNDPLIFSSRGNYATSSDTYKKGFGFVGPYAQQWVEAIPPMEGTTINSVRYWRKTYVA